MEETNISQEQNPLGTAPVGGLIGKFAIPAIISMLVSALYNIVDQIFIGQGVGMLGNAATNVAFPVTTIATALALLLGIGGASNYNLEMGAGREKKASSIAGTALSTLVITGVILAVAVLLFLRPLLSLFGATTDVMPYAVDYLGITAVGLPFYALSIGGNHIVRADRSPTYSMTCVLTGAIINTILDPLFIFGFGWGIKGAAWATVIGQVVSGILVVIYFGKFRKMYLEMSMLKPSSECLKAIISLGMASCINQIAMAIVQIVLNNILRYYGGLSVYGSDIPIACVGVISKVNQDVYKRQAYMYDTGNFYLLVKTREEEFGSQTLDLKKPAKLRLIKSDHFDVEDVIPAISIPEDGPVYLRVITTQEGLYANFFYSLDGKDYQELAEVPTNILTDEQSDGFTGAHFGMYCHDMTGGRRYADFDYFEIVKTRKEQ